MTINHVIMYVVFFFIVRNPTPKTVMSEKLVWLPVREGKMTYLEIGPTIQNIKGAIAEKRMLFWDDVYRGKQKLRNNL